MDKLGATVNKVLEVGISRAQLSRELGLGSGDTITKWSNVKRAHTNKQFEAIKILRGMLKIDDIMEIQEVEVEEGQSLFKDGEELKYNIQKGDFKKPGESREAKLITVKFKGEEITGTVPELARRFGQKPVTVYTRLRNNYTNEEAFSLVESSRLKSKRTIKSDEDSRSTITLTYNDKTQGIREWAEELNLKEPTIRGRINRGWETDRILNTASPSMN